MRGGRGDRDDDDGDDGDDLADLDDLGGEDEPTLSSPPDEPVPLLDEPDIDVDDEPSRVSVDDEGGTELLEDDDLTLDEAPEASTAARIAAALPVLRWSTRARLVDLGLELDAVLDPTRADSEWIVTDPPTGSMHAVVEVGTVRARARLVRRLGAREELRLGRDFLAGRALVASD